MLIKFMVFSVLLFSMNVIAQAQTWVVGQATDKTSRWALTLNDSNGALKQRCVPEEGLCYWSIMILTKCESKAEFPVLASTDAGASHLNLYCGGSAQVGKDLYYEYYFSNFDAIDNLIRSSKSIGIAMPLESGRFRVVRFLLEDATSKIDQMRALTSVDIDKKKKKSTKDSIL